MIDTKWERLRTWLEHQDQLPRDDRSADSPALVLAVMDELAASPEPMCEADDCSLAGPHTLTEVCPDAPPDAPALTAESVQAPTCATCQHCEGDDDQGEGVLCVQPEMVGRGYASFYYHAPQNFGCTLHAPLTRPATETT